ncbi:condensation domain-containing protein [Spirillospora sp. CA-294931]|uniref:condensation domain-containing protein n=1 Tax=Spirillospora sp. CA-294931 TaxID=3240042 RepID=UPI003D917882
MIELTPRRFTFEGTRATTGPCTVGQWDFWRKMHRPGEPAFADMSSGGLLPPGTTLDRVLDGLRELVERHESLRTLFREDGRGGLVQEVRRRGELSIEIIALDTLDELYGIVGDWRPLPPGVRHDPRTDLPFGARVGLIDGRPVFFQLWMAHLAADFLSSQVLAAELVELLGDDAAERPPITQPIEKAAQEHTEKGRRTLERALDHWRRELDAAPRTMFPAPPGEPASPRFWRGGLRSHAVPPALDLLAARYRVGATHVLLAAAAVMIGGYTGLDRCAVRLMAGNRTKRELRHSVGNLAQEVLSVIDLGGDTFEDAVRATWTASLRAQRHGQFDADAAAALVEAADVELSVGFNDLWTPIRADTAPEGAPHGESVFAWENKVERASVTFFLEVFEVLDDPSAVRLSLLADTAHLPPPAIRAFLTGIERLLLALVERDLYLKEIEPVERFLRPAQTS